MNSHITRSDTLTFFDGFLSDTAADQGVVSCLVPNDIQQKWHVGWVAKGNFGHHCSLE